MARDQKLQLEFRERLPWGKCDQVIDIAPNQWVTIGRSPDCNFTRRLVNGAVSRIHVTLSKNNDGSWIVIDGTDDKPSENGIFNKTGQRLHTHTSDGKLSKPLRLSEPGDMIYLVPTNDRKEQAYLQVIDLNALTDNNPTLRLEEKIEAAHQQSVVNGEILKAVAGQNEHQSKRLDQFEESLKAMRMTAEFIDSVSSDGKKFRRQVFTTLALILLVTFGKVMFFDGGGKQILDAFFPPSKEQKK